MTYSSCGKACAKSYQPPSGLDNVVNKFYINIGSLNVNNGIQHSIAAERTGDIKVYNTTIDNRIGQVNYTINLDNRKVEFISPYIGRQTLKYLDKKSGYMLPAPSEYRIANPEYQSMITTGLLKPKRPLTQFVDNAEEIKGITKQTFEELTGQPFPDDIIVRVCSEEELKKAHTANGGKWNPGIMGFALNRSPQPSTIFVRQNHLDALMLTVGHEIGHVLTPSLGNPVDEEAKAFAFELAWAKTIIENDIGGLKANFNVDFMPAQNGLHDKAFAFVQNIVKKGMDSLRLFFDISQGTLSHQEKAFI